MLDARGITLTAELSPPLPVAAMMQGKSRTEVAALMPRLFNLCRAAQGMAARLALGLPSANDAEALRAEILRDHVLRLAVVLPRHFGQTQIALPTGWQAGGSALRQALFGPRGALPRTMDDFRTFLHSGQGIASLWAQVDGVFDATEAVSSDLPYVGEATATDPAALVENSCALRVATHPVVAALGRTGRGPLWRVVARSYDLEALLDGAPLTAACPTPGTAHVPATRGLYTVAAETDGETVTHFHRVTPTQHLIATGGVLDQTLASLPAHRARLAPLVIDILDPCSPIRVKESADA